MIIIMIGNTCSLQVWISASLQEDGTVRLEGDSDSQLSRGLCAVAFASLDGKSPQQILQV